MPLKLWCSPLWIVAIPRQECWSHGNTDPDQERTETVDVYFWAVSLPAGFHYVALGHQPIQKHENKKNPSHSEHPHMILMSIKGAVNPLLSI